MLKHASWRLLVSVGLVLGSLLSPVNARENIEDIVFASNRSIDGNMEIYLVNPDGTNIRQLTFDGSHDTMPTWSPNKTQIAFISTRDSRQGGIYIMSPTGQNVRKILDNFGACEQPAWSPDGQTIAFVSDFGGSREIYAVGLNGETPEKIITASLQEDASSPAWSPDGRQMAYLSNKDERLTLYIRDIYTGRDIYKYQDLGSDDEVSALAWSPQGRLAFAVRREVGSELYMLNLGASPTYITDTENGNILSLSWSPDGQSLLYTLGNGKKSAAHRIDVNNGSLTVVLPDEFNNHYVAWSAPPQAAPLRASRPTAQPSIPSTSTNTSKGINMPRIPPANQRNFAPSGAVRLAEGRGITNGDRQTDGNFQVEGYCPNSISMDGYNWYCGGRQLRVEDFDKICRSTYNAQNAFAIRDGGSRIEAYNWRCYVFRGSVSISAEPPINGTCRNSPSSRLAIGRSARVIADRLSLRALPGGERLTYIPSGAVVPILGGPDCGSVDATYNNMTFWYTRYQGVEGWVAEGYQGEYWLWDVNANSGPLLPTPIPTNIPESSNSSDPKCSRSPNARMIVGGRGYVTTEGHMLVMTRNPYRGRNNVKVDILKKGVTFDVIDGPICDSGLRYWRIRVDHNQFVGWVPEGDNGERWIAPN